MIPLLIVALGLIGGGAWLVVLAARASRQSRQLLARPTTPIARLAVGPVEIAGTLRADGATVPGPMNLPCLIVHTVVEQKVSKNLYRELRRDTVAVPVTLTDDSGSCAVSLGHTDLLGEMFERNEDRVRTTVILVRDGARVVVSGVAREAPAESAGDYRGSVTRKVVGAADDAPLLVAVGGEPGAVWRHGWRALVALLSGGLLILLGAAAAALAALLA